MSKIYVGRVASNFDPKKNNGYIALDTVRCVNDEAHDLDTERDIFIHASKCNMSLRAGMELEFTVVPDRKREKAYRVDAATETDGSRLVSLEQGGIELHLQSTSGGRHPQALEHSSVFVSWCLSDALRARIKALIMDGKTVRLLFISWSTAFGGHDKHYERRDFADPFAPMAYLAFDRGGEHRIVALLVWERSLETLTDLYLRRAYNVWATDVISTSGDSICLKEGEKENRFSSSSPVVHWFGTGYAQLNVPEALFVKKPWDEPWLMWLSNKPLKDECDTWRRRALAYSVQLIPGAVAAVCIGLNWLAAAASVLVLFSFGYFKNINWKPLREPWGFYFVGVWQDLKGPSWFGFNVSGHRISIPKPLLPGGLAIEALLVLGVIRLGSHHWSWSMTPFVDIVLVFTAIWTGFAIIGFAIRCFDEQFWKKLSAWLDARQRVRWEQEIDKNLEALVCTPNAKRLPDVNKLPLRPRTFRFFFLAHKQAHCKGYAKE